MSKDTCLVSGELIKRSEKALGEMPERYLFISLPCQTITLNHGNRIQLCYQVSTGAKGRGAEDGSNKTPTGIFRIRAMIGGGAPLGRIFRGREDTGEEWDKVSMQENLILSRIIRLDGLEPGINRGSGMDTWSRYIYIHGTNREDAVGREPVSHGCICMKNNEIIDLFSKIKEGDIVFID